MSENLSAYDTVKYTDKRVVEMGPSSPHLHKCSVDKIAVTLTHNFVNQLFIAARECEDDLTIVDILNSQLTGFQIKSTSRLATRLHNITYEVNNNFRNKYGSGNSRYVYGRKTTKMAILKDELLDIQDLTFHLNEFQREN